MPLVKDKIIANIRKIIDQEYQNFSGFPNSPIEASFLWSDAINDYAKGVIPASVNSQGATSALQNSLLSVPILGENAFVIGLNMYSVQLATGMQPAFTATPPPTPIILKPAFDLGFLGASSEEVAIKMGEIIHSWFKTGTAINNSSGATVNWN